MRILLRCATVMIALLASNLAAADELPTPGEMRLVWKMDPFRAPPGVPDLRWVNRGISEIVPLLGGDLLVSWYEDEYTLHFVRVAPDGSERWRVEYPYCPPGAFRTCEHASVADIEISLISGHRFVAFVGGSEFRFYSESNGEFLSAQLIRPCGGPISQIRGDAFYFAGNCDLRDQSYLFGSGSLVRWERICGECWHLQLSFRADGINQEGYALDLDFLANGNLLWTVYGETPMNLDPRGRWQVRVTPSGQIVPPGPLETSVQSDSGQWQVFANALLADGRLLRLGRYSRGPFKDRIRAEFWDGTGSQLLGAHILDFGQHATVGYDQDIYYPAVFYVDARGDSVFYLLTINFRAGVTSDLLRTEIAGFDETGKLNWRMYVDGGVVGDGQSSRLYVFGDYASGPERHTAPAIYLTTVE